MRKCEILQQKKLKENFQWSLRTTSNLFRVKFWFSFVKYSDSVKKERRLSKEYKKIKEKTLSVIRRLSFLSKTLRITYTR